MAGKDRSDRAKAGPSLGGEFSGYRKDTQWDRARRDAERCTYVHPAEPGDTSVYVIADALGRHKIGVSGDDAAARLCALNYLVEAERRPLRLAWAVQVPYLTAYDVEARAHRKLASCNVSGEWFAATAEECKQAVLTSVDESLFGKPKDAVPRKRRPVFTDADMAKAKAVWESRKYRTWQEAAAALPKGFTPERAYRIWGKRQ
jgi:hypothetical protein